MLEDAGIKDNAIYIGYYGRDKRISGDPDKVVISRGIPNRMHFPPVRFDCGTSDQLIEYNRTLHRQMQQQGISHEYKEFPGGHQWSYWEKHISKSLLFFKKLLPKDP